MPSHLSRRLMTAAAACGVVLTLGLAIGCTPEGAPGTGPDHRSMVMPTTGPSPGATVQPTNDNNQQTTTVSYQTQVVPLLQNRCAACHGSPQTGGPSLFDASGNARYSNIKGNIIKIIDEVSDGGMPKNGQRFTQAEVQTLETWEMEGSPNN